DIFPGTYGSFPDFLANVNGTLYFAANDSTHGPELWQSDGTAAGTTMVADINPGGGGSYPYFVANVNGTLYFTANDGTHGRELWQSDGTAAGTTMVADINPGPGYSSAGNLTDVNRALFFTANDGVRGLELWMLTPATASITGPLAGALNQTLTFTLAVKGYPAGTAFTFNIDWNGDGTVDQTISGSSGTTVSHSYSSSGVQNINVTATDPDGVTSKPGTLSVSVLPVSMPGGGSPVDLVVVTGEGGNDTIDARGLSISTALVGGTGNDTLYGGSARNLLIGGAGADTLN